MLDVRKSYGVGTAVETEVLHGITLSLQPAEFVALRGPSGSGKSTLLNIIGLLEPPTSGRLILAGYSTAELDDRRVTDLRGQAIGFVFPFAAGFYRAGERAAALDDGPRCFAARR